MAHIILGVSASIALHRGLDLCSELKKAGHEISVVMTTNAKKLIAPQMFQAISHSKVHHDMWEMCDNFDHDHIRMAQDADLMVIAPATASTIGKLAHGILDNILITTAYAFQGTKIMAPAMNHRMWAHPIVQENCVKLASLGWQQVEPEIGDLACGEQGEGRLAKVESITAAINTALKTS